MDNCITTEQSFVVVLDSRNATSILNGSFNSIVIFDFEEPIVHKYDSVMFSCCVNSFTCANSIYIINENNSLLSITVNGITTNYIILYGNYNAQTFATQLISQIGLTFSITINNINNIFTLSNTQNNFSINSNSTIWQIMGLAQNTTYTSINNNLTMPFTCNFNGIQSININFENLLTENVDSLSKSNSSVIQSIVVDNTLQQITYLNSNNFKFLIKQDVISFIQIELRDDLEIPINLNNQHWNLSLAFTDLVNIDRFAKYTGFHNIQTKGYN